METTAYVPKAMARRLGALVAKTGTQRLCLDTLHIAPDSAAALAKGLAAAGGKLRQLELIGTTPKAPLIAALLDAVSDPPSGLRPLELDCLFVGGNGDIPTTLSNRMRHESESLFLRAGLGRSR